MPPDLDPSTLPTRVQSSLKKLSAAAASLNAASDTFSKQISEIDSALRPMNIGISCWVKIRNWSSPDSRGHDEVGYAKVNGKWGIALRSVDEHISCAEDDEIWAFSEGPRDLRLSCIDHIPALLDKLADQAAKNTADIQRRTIQMVAIVSAVKGETAK